MCSYTFFGDFDFLFLAIPLNVVARLYLFEPGGHVGPPYLSPVQTPFVPRASISFVAFWIQSFDFFAMLFVVRNLFSSIVNDRLYRLIL